MRRIIVNFSARKMIEPQQAQIQPFEGMWKISSKTFQFVTKVKPQSALIYEHQINTPAGVLKKPGIHILSQKMPQLNKRQKLTAVTKKIQENYRDSFRNCKTGKQIFHLDRLIKGQIRKKLSLIGNIQGQKFKHLLLFKPLVDIMAQKTQQQYQKKGVMVDLIGKKIFPHGKVWMPTSERYLTHFVQIIKSIQSTKQMKILDIGCGSGILSFLFAKQHKRSKVYAIDVNPAAVQTCSINAASLELMNIQAAFFDVLKQKQFQLKMSQIQFPHKYDWILLNPPWIAASKLQGQSQLADGVYDQNGNMLQHSIRLAKRLLNQQGKIIIIYSDLSELLGLNGKAVQKLCQQNELTIEQRRELPLMQKMAKQSALQQFKTKSKILTYVIKK